MKGKAPALILCLVAAAAGASDSHVPGAAFDHIFQVWLENGDYDVSPPIIRVGTAGGRRTNQRQEAASDENMKWIASNGILLTNFYACKLTTYYSRNHHILSLTLASNPPLPTQLPTCSEW